jgi:hypothetical protein
MEQRLSRKSRISLAGHENPCIVRVRTVLLITAFTKARQFLRPEKGEKSTSAHFISTRSTVILFAYS